MSAGLDCDLVSMPATSVTHSAAYIAYVACATIEVNCVFTFYVYTDIS